MPRHLITCLFVLTVFVSCTPEGSDPRSDIAPTPQETSDGVETGPSPSASPTPTDGPLISWDFVFKGKVSKGLRRTVQWHTERATRFFAAPELGLAREKRYAEIYGEESPYDSETSYCGQLTEAGGIRIYLLSCGQSDEATRIELVETITHEVFHAVQQRVIEANDLKPHAFVDGMLPHWFMEGAATWASAIAMDDWGLRSYQTSRDISLQAADVVEASLRKLETGRGWFAGDDTQQIAQYGLSFLGVERVAKKDWLSSLQVYAAAVAEQVPDWRSAFEDTFDLNQKRFYKEFERSRDRGFP